MSVSTDISLIDILFDRDDPVLKFAEDKDVFKQEFDVLDSKTDLLNEKLEPWVTDADDLLKDILNDEHFNLLGRGDGEPPIGCFDTGISDWKPVTNDGYGIKEVVVGSSSSAYSDSGLSSDQVSPGLPIDYDFTPSHLDEDDDIDDGHTSSAVSTISDGSASLISPIDIKVEPPDVTMQGIWEDEMAVAEILQQSSQPAEVEKKKVHQVSKLSAVVGSNPRSILLPVNTGNGIKTYKIINSSNGHKTLKAIGTLSNGNSMVLKNIRPVGVPLVLKNVKSSNATKKLKSRQVKYTTEETDDDEEVTVLSDSEDDKVKSQYPRLILSPEEKKLIQKEGVRLPSHYPLTKFEERELKRIRRKIRNKISAQDSRKRKKEYLDGLEDRVKQCTEENLSLMKKIKILQSQNQSLMTQLKKLQLTLAKTTTKTAQPATCLMVIMLSVALIMAPSLRITQNNENEMGDQEVSDNTVQPVAGRTRSLLSKATPQDAVNDEENKHVHEMQYDHPTASFNSPYSYMDMDLSSQNAFSVKSDRSRKSSIGSTSSGYDSPPHFLVDHDYDPPPSKRNRFHFDGFNKESEEEILRKQFILPPVDDSWPQSSRETATKPKEFIIPDVDDKWVPNQSILIDKIESLTTEVKVNISDSKGSRTVVIHVPKE
ncbi:hypothetical protein RUM44_005961 [Polyplax serrata]|uniref:BZIP domain-containing protein n=1 Tax=Polyplax serrata TaxID=468196 RepID=A0ABR1AYK6_POLSC